MHKDTFFSRLSDTSGQAMLLTTGIGLVLVLGIVSVVSINQLGSFHQHGSAQRLKGRAVASEGIAYATQLISKDMLTWNQAQAGTFAPGCTGIDVKSPSGSIFRLYCSTGIISNPGHQDYEISVTAVTMSQIKSNGIEKPIRAIKAYLAPRTVGIDTETGIHSSAALLTVLSPSVAPGGLNVHWGPIISMDPAGLTVSDPMDSSRYPRKFSIGPVTGTSFLRSGAGNVTDDKEYWSSASMTPNPVIDEAGYAAGAKSESYVIPAPTSLLTGAPLAPTCTGANTQCGYFDVTPGDTAVFDAPGGYTAPSHCYIYVNGHAQFKRMALTGAQVIIEGQLTVTDASAGLIYSMHVPATAALEYPYASPPTAYPCSSETGDLQVNGSPVYDCTSTDPSVTTTLFPGGKVHFQGFLFVKGNMHVNVPNWNMVGCLFVGNRQALQGTGGRLYVSAGNSLNLAYDDWMNHLILVSPLTPSGTLMIVPDWIRDVPVP